MSTTAAKVTKTAGEKKPKATKTAVKKKPMASKTANHPSYFDMIKEAFSCLKERSGSSQYATAKYMEGKHKAFLPANFRKMLALQLRNSAAKGKLLKIKASFKLSKAAKKSVPSKKAATKAKNPAAKAKAVNKVTKPAAKKVAVVKAGKKPIAKAKKPKSIKSPTIKRAKKVTAKA